MFREEELAQQPVYLKQALAAETENVALGVEQALVTQSAEGLGEALLDIHAEFVLEVRTVDVPEFHLKNELPDHAFFRSRCHRAIDRRIPLPDLLDVGLEFVLILKMRTADMRERRDTEPDHIGASPQQVPIEEAALVRVLYSGVGAGDRISGALE